MNKFSLIKVLGTHGDVVLIVKDKTTGVTTESLCTSDFSNKYIKAHRETRPLRSKGTVTVFNWTENRFEMINPQNVVKFIPLAQILQNKRDK